MPLTHLSPSQFFSGCHPWVGLSFAKVPAGYLLWCQCTAELHVLNDMYTRSILVSGSERVIFGSKFPKFTKRGRGLAFYLDSDPIQQEVKMSLG